VTGGNGEVFYWEKPLSQTQKDNLFPHVVAVIGSPQNTLALLETGEKITLVCGGRDGVLRAFDTEGRLCWANVLPGIIRGITSLPQSYPQSHWYSALAVLCDSEHLFLFNENGLHQGILHLPHHTLYSLSRTTIGNDQIPCHILGDFTGKILVVEETPLTESNTVLGKHLLKELLEQYCQSEKILKELLEQYCQSENILKEPLRAAWAAITLLKQHNDFNTILNVLKEIKTNFDSSSRDLRAHIFQEMGKKFNDIPTKLHKDISILCGSAKDGAFC
jgi:hypothetical protein